MTSKICSKHKVIVADAYTVDNDDCELCQTNKEGTSMVKYLIIKVSEKGISLIETRYALPDVIITLLEKDFTNEAVFLAKLKQLPATIQCLTKELDKEVACSKCLNEFPPSCCGMYLITVKDKGEG